MVMIDTWRERMSEDMRLRDFRPRTQEGYMAATRQFIEWLGRGPESATDKDVRRYFLYLREVRSVVGVVRDPVRRMALATIYALGLRLNEGMSLETGHIDSERLTVWVRNGKGAKDRGVPLPRPLLARLRQYWKAERPASPTSDLFVAAAGKAPLHEPTLQKTERLQETLDRMMVNLYRARAPMILGLADVLRRHAPADLEHYQEAMLPSHANEFLRRFRQHVLPKGFHRVRAFGLLHPAHRATLRRLQLQLAPPVARQALVPPSPAPPRLRCPHCGQPALRLVRRLSPQQCADRLDRAELDPSHAARAPP